MCVRACAGGGVGNFVRQHSFAIATMTLVVNITDVLHWFGITDDMLGTFFHHTGVIEDRGLRKLGTGSIGEVAHATATALESETQLVCFDAGQVFLASKSCETPVNGLHRRA